MNWLCVAKVSTALAVALALSSAVGALAFGLGMRAANRRYWRMMHRAGSKITRDW